MEWEGKWTAALRNRKGGIYFAFGGKEGVILDAVLYLLGPEPGLLAFMPPQEAYQHLTGFRGFKLNTVEAIPVADSDQDHWILRSSLAGEMKISRESLAELARFVIRAQKGWPSPSEIPDKAAFPDPGPWIHGQMKSLGFSEKYLEEKHFGYLLEGIAFEVNQDEFQFPGPEREALDFLVSLGKAGSSVAGWDEILVHLLIGASWVMSGELGFVLHPIEHSREYAKHDQAFSEVLNAATQRWKESHPEKSMPDLFSVGASWHRRNYFTAVPSCAKLFLLSRIFRDTGKIAIVEGLQVLTEDEFLPLKNPLLALPAPAGELRKLMQECYSFNPEHPSAGEKAGKLLVLLKQMSLFDFPLEEEIEETFFQLGDENFYWFLEGMGEALRQYISGWPEWWPESPMEFQLVAGKSGNEWMVSLIRECWEIGFGGGFNTLKANPIPGFGGSWVEIGGRKFLLHRERCVDEVEWLEGETPAEAMEEYETRFGWGREGEISWEMIYAWWKEGENG